MEKEQGVTFFKKDVLLKSEDGKSEVLMRFACTDKDILEAQIANNIMSIVPDLKSKIKNIEEKILEKPFTSVNSESNSTSKTKAMIVVEAVSEKLADGVEGYSFSLKSKSQNVNNGKVAYFSNWWIIVSDNWPHRCEIKAWSYIRYSYRHKVNWTGSWSSPSNLIYWPWVGEYNNRPVPYSSYFGLMEKTDDISGPWKVRIEVDADDATDFAVRFYRLY